MLLVNSFFFFFFEKLLLVNLFVIVELEIGTNYNRSH